MIRTSTIALLLAVLLTFTASAEGQDPLVSASGGGLQTVDDALGRLTEHRRLLMIAAHPDDEDTFLLTLVSKGQYGEAAYLSLSRGDGGQNLIGAELGEGLGLLRSRELEAARRIDGARQFFSRAYDFGYTRSLEETLERWPRQILLDDAMRVVRRFRPQVLVAVFPPTAAAGHGQHQASAWVAERIFELSRQADDPFPELAAEGLDPWRITSLYRAAWFRPNTASMNLPIGQLDPITGRSIFQTALLSRSQHRCQDMGFEQPPGAAMDAVLWLDGDRDPEDLAIDDDIFAGIETSLPALAGALTDEELKRELESDLAVVESIATATRQGLAPVSLEKAISPLKEIVTRLDRAYQVFTESDGVSPETGDGQRHVAAFLAEKLAIARRGLAAAAGIVADSITDLEAVTPGETFEIKTLFWNAGNTKVENLTISLEPTESADEWIITREQPEESDGRRSPFAATVDDEGSWKVTVPDNTAPSTPYFLRQQRDGDLYRWDGVDSEVKNLPFEPPTLIARFRFDLAGAPMELAREVVHRRRDQALGEVRRPLRVTPALEVEVDQGLIVWPTDRRQPLVLVAQVISHLDRPVEAELHVEVPAGWPGVATRKVTLDASGRAEVRLEIPTPANLEPGSTAIALSATLDGREYRHRYLQIDYSHIRPTLRPQVAKTALRVVGLEIPSLKKIAYVRGASDRVPEMAKAIGLPIELVDAEELLVADLATYDAIVLGSRAYEVETALAAANKRLLDYVKAGGLMIVQYQQYSFSRGAYAPLPLEIHRPHDRVTDETAAVRLLDSEHPVFQHPNQLGPNDWQGWVQERGLYFAGTWDDGWTPLLAMADPGGEEKLGSLLITQLGEGHYVYTGLAFFRQLPAGVGGAYRLFANLLALAED